MQRKIQNALPLAAFAALITSASADITIDWVTIGNANNAADSADGDLYTDGYQHYGAVDHAYQIGKYEVTNAQYGEFLNAKGQSNSNDIYNSSMSSYGITQSGSSGSYSYMVDSALANRPVVYVSWFDAARFSNWMSNGQGSGDMETGSYTLNGATSGIIAANIGAQVYIPSENEWYKAAYYNATNAAYSRYPNGQNTITNANANYNHPLGSSTDVGTYTNDASSYGTFDQGGHGWEWSDGVGTDWSDGEGLALGRETRGGAWYSEGALGFYLHSSFREAITPSLEEDGFGFRVASVIPEPTSMILTMLASGMMLSRRKR
jgi:formylglycine-generating enzyme required for sulfatase activity